VVAIQFFILAPYVGVEADRALVNGSHPEESMLGIALDASSVAILPLLGSAPHLIRAQTREREARRDDAERRHPEIALPFRSAPVWHLPSLLGLGVEHAPVARLDAVVVHVVERVRLESAVGVRAGAIQAAVDVHDVVVPVARP
jgi:hypothetical protein